MSRARVVFDRLGTPDAVSWPAFWATLFANLLVSFASGMDVQVTWAQRLLVLALSQAGAFGFLLLFRKLVLDRSGGRSRPWATLGAFVVSGALRGLIAGELLIAFSGAPHSVLTYRIAAGIALFVAVLVPTALIVSTARGYRRARQDLLARDVQLRAARARVVEAIEQRDAETVARIEAQLTQALTSAAPDEQARRLEQVAAEVVRPLSHELAQSMPTWEPPEPNQVKVRLGAILARATTGSPLMPLATSLAGGIMFAGYALDRIGLWVVPGFVAYVALSWAALWLGNQILARLLRWGPLVWRLALVLVVLALAGLLMGAAMDATLGNYGRANLAAAIPILYCLFGLTLALARAGDQELEASLTQLEQVDSQLTWQLKRLNMQQWCQQRTLSRALHGPLQSSIAASVERLRSGDQAEADRMRGDMLAALDSRGRTGDDVWSNGLEQLRATWRGVCEVRTEGDAGGPTLDADTACAEMALEIVSEAVSNAVRHGHAASVSICLDIGADRVGVCVTDDGSGGAGSGKGLGTQLLEDCALTWSRTSAEGCTVLEATLPFEGV